VTWLDYKVWQFGPVAPETFFIKDNDHLFTKYISTRKSENGTVIIPSARFNENPFSEYELDIIENVISGYGNLSSEDLVQLTHEPDSLWSITKKENDIDFENALANISDISIDLKRLISTDKHKLSNYEGAREMMLFNLPVKTTIPEECIG
ncbi:MAG: type II toxin-antitoxin system antitoxin SocA domain-containing protein, partial [Paludibacter sp.]